MAIREHGLYRRYETPPADAAKASCYLTGSGDAGVDTGVHIEFEGTLCLSLNSIKELAEVAGFSVNVEGEELERENAELLRQLAVQDVKIAEMNEQLIAVGVAIARARGDAK